MNCKPGDMAVQILSQFPKNIGGLVEVIESIAPGVWNVRCLNEGTGMCLSTGELYTSPPGDICEVADYELIPLKGVLAKNKELEAV